MLDVTGLFSPATAGLAECYVGSCWVPPTLAAHLGLEDTSCGPVARRGQGL